MEVMEERTTAFCSAQNATKACKDLSQANVHVRTVFRLPEALSVTRQVNITRICKSTLELDELTVHADICEISVDHKLDFAKQLHTTMQGNIKPSEAHFSVL